MHCLVALTNNSTLSVVKYSNVEQNQHLVIPYQTNKNYFIWLKKCYLAKHGHYYS